MSWGHKSKETPQGREELAHFGIVSITFAEQQLVLANLNEIVYLQLSFAFDPFAVDPNAVGAAEVFDEDTV